MFLSFFDYLFIVFSDVVVSTKEVLSTLSCRLAIVDGMFGTVVVTGKAAGAAVVMLPMWKVVCESDVSNGAHLGAKPATDAIVGIHGELVVGDHLLVEESAYNIGEEPRQWTFQDVALLWLAL